MQANKKIFSFLILSALTLLLAGCPAFRRPLEVALKPDFTQQQSNTMSKRFQDTTPKGQTVVDSAIELAKRHTKLSEEVSVLRLADMRPGVAHV